jgi:hypothetical protein
MKHRLAFALLMGFITTCLISFTLTSINVGYTGRFFKVWFRSWGIAWVVAVLAILVIGPAVQKLVNKILK